MSKDEAEREQAARRVQEKQQRVQAFEDQREALMRELECTRAEIAGHEAYLKVGTRHRASPTFVSSACPQFPKEDVH